MGYYISQLPYLRFPCMLGVLNVNGLITLYTISYHLGPLPKCPYTQQPYSFNQNPKYLHTL